MEAWLTELERALDLPAARDRDHAIAGLAHARIKAADLPGARLALQAIGSIAERLDVVAHLVVALPADAERTVGEAFVIVGGRDLASGRADALGHLIAGLVRHGAAPLARLLVELADEQAREGRLFAMACSEDLEAGNADAAIEGVALIQDATEAGWVLARIVRSLGRAGDFLAADKWARRLTDRRYRAWARSELAHAKVAAGFVDDLHLSAHATSGVVELNAMRHEMANIEAGARRRLIAGLA
jgi:hypothetical protein